MKKVFLLVLTIALLSISAVAMAGNPILDSLQSQGVNAEKMDNAALNEVRGTSLITGQSMPSTLSGIREHHVTYLGWGSYDDYHSYNYVGSGFTPGLAGFDYNGQIIAVAGDVWKRDTKSDPNSWSAANANMVEYHLQAMYALGQPSQWAFRVSNWNRPMTTFSW
ncbi:hypothetical protein [Desulfovibrio gilichinskyi]|uniref:Uncharacterized protein n=1 Tax=Desulfovibrio gilichinskyi TaxID=1519643 RepID=A0A1X7DJK1_9BACT|nr:hypothetical protein [Desulfovibrio gilichinskyi]SMF16719.1 hypothetical protein SAMN06295933_1986 [Desulfovibrio gilichinskyi]